MNIIDKLFFKTDEEQNKKRLSKLKIGTMILLVVILIVIGSSINTAIHQHDAVLIPNILYNYLPGELSAYEKVDYVLENYGHYNELRYGGYDLWLVDSGANDKWYAEEVFSSYDTDHDGRLNKSELTVFIREIEYFQNYAKNL